MTKFYALFNLVSTKLKLYYLVILVSRLHFAIKINKLFPIIYKYFWSSLFSWLKMFLN